MIKILSGAVFCLLLTVSTVAKAQISIGLKAGVNFSNFTGGDFGEIETNALLGFHAGGFVHIKAGKLIIQPELIFSSQGAQLSNAGIDSNFKVSYVNIPVVLQYETEGGFYIESGLQIGFKLSEDIPNQTIEEFAASTDLSIPFGLGYHSKKGFGIGARYNVGVSKVGEFDAANFDPDFKNGVLQISLFYTFLNKGKNKKSE